MKLNEIKKKLEFEFYGILRLIPPMRQCFKST